MIRCPTTTIPPERRLAYVMKQILCSTSNNYIVAGVLNYLKAMIPVDINAGLLPPYNLIKHTKYGHILSKFTHKPFSNCQESSFADSCQHLGVSSKTASKRHHRLEDSQVPPARIIPNGFSDLRKVADVSQ